MIKIYLNENDFLKDNYEIINKNIIETSFLVNNSKYLDGLFVNNYMFKVIRNDSYLIFGKYKKFPLVSFGNVELMDEAVDFIIKHNLNVDKILMSNIEIDKFSYFYNKVFDSTCNKTLDMSVMKLDKLLYKDFSIVEKINLSDLDQIATLYCLFKKEVMNEEADSNTIKKHLLKSIDKIYGIKINNNIVSVAMLTRVNDQSAAISFVYTKKEFRNKGYSKKVVSYISNFLSKDNKIVYLFVDNNNPVSNHLYKSIGYIYLNKKSNYELKYNNIKKALFAGGCFWCMAKPYYSYDGILKVYSGFAGGDIVEPTYEEVKKGNTKHKETIMILYDSSKITYKELLNIYFSSIDPFDSDGQFIDRGSNYTTAIFTSNNEEINEIILELNKIEKKYNKKTCVPIINDTIFYMAEEYHQDYALKNPLKMQKELQKSGRNKK